MTGAQGEDARLDRVAISRRKVGEIMRSVVGDGVR